MVPRRPAITAFFLLLGIPFCGFLWVMGVLGNSLGALSDSAVGMAGPVAPVKVVPAFALYFVCGASSALATRVEMRRMLAAVAHIVPVGCILFVGSGQVLGLLGILVFAFAVFSVAWVRMLCSENSRLYQLTTSARSS